MGIFDIFKTPKKVEPSFMEIGNNKIPLRIIKGRIIDYKINERKSYFDKSGNIVRFGDVEESEIDRIEPYLELTITLRTFEYDSFMKPNHHESKTNIYFIKNSMFENFNIGDIITYFGLFIKPGASWTDLILLNNSNNSVVKLYSPESINQYFFKDGLRNDIIEKEISDGISNLIQ